MSRRRRHQEHEHHERWAIPYGDLITLLLAFFVIMYALSAVDAGKYQVVSDALQANLRSTPQSPDPLQIGEIGQMDNALSRSFTSLEGAQPQASDPVREAGVLRTMQAADVNVTEQRAEVDRLEQAVREALDDLGERFAPSLDNRGLWLELEVNNRGLFESASADLSPGAERFFAQLAERLADLPVHVRVEGHTDNRPIDTSRYPSNWELSGARAASVVRLMSASGLNGDRLVAMGYGASRPVAENATETGRERNRRVVMVLVRPPEFRGERIEFAAPGGKV